MSFGSSGGADSSIPAFKKFISEDELEEKRQKRQEEWEKVRKAEDPEEAPEEEYDNRCLFQILEEQKQKKQDELDDKHRMSNQVKGLESDEAQFLDFVSQKQQEITKQRENEEQEVISQYRDAMLNQVTPATSSADVKAKSNKPSASGAPQGAKKSQMALLAGAVKRKSQDTAQIDEKKHKPEPSATSPEPDSTGGSTSSTAADRPQVARVIGILPGLGAYDNSSESDGSSSDSDDIELPGNIFPKKIVICQGES